VLKTQGRSLERALQPRLSLLQYGGKKQVPKSLITFEEPCTCFHIQTPSQRHATMQYLKVFFQVSSRHGCFESDEPFGKQESDGHRSRGAGERVHSSKVPVVKGSECLLQEGDGQDWLGWREVLRCASQLRPQTHSSSTEAAGPTDLVAYLQAAAESKVEWQKISIDRGCRVDGPGRHPFFYTSCTLSWGKSTSGRCSSSLERPLARSHRIASVVAGGKWDPRWRPHPTGPKRKLQDHLAEALAETIIGRARLRLRRAQQRRP